MDDTQKLLKTIINGQSAMKSELLAEIRKVGKRVDDLVSKVDNGFDKVNKLMDKLVNRVDKIQKSFVQ